MRSRGSMASEKTDEDTGAKGTDYSLNELSKGTCLMHVDSASQTLRLAFNTCHPPADMT